MTIPARDEEYPSRIWVPPHACEHPRRSIAFTGQFPPEDIELSVLDARCYKCGSAWNQDSSDAPYAQLMEKIALGEFGVVSVDNPEIASGVEWMRQNRYADIMRDAEEARNNPILGTDIHLPCHEYE